MSSSEVRGAEDEQSATELLKEKRAALASARERYAVAKTMRDEDAMSEESRRMDALKVLIAELESESAGEREAVGVKAAEGRLLALKRAFGGLLSTYREDEERVRLSVTALREAITTLNDRARKLEQLRDEATGLADRFALGRIALPAVREPAGLLDVSLPAFWRAHATRPEFETCEYGLRSRRTYEELGGTEAYRIIESAGLKSFPALTARQQRAVDALVGQQEANAPQLAELGVEATIEHAIPWTGPAGIQRG